MCEGLHRLIDTWMPYPAHIMDVYWDCIMFNDAAAMTLSMRQETPQNCLVAFFADPLYRERATSWQRNAPDVVDQYRAACSDHPDDDGFKEIVTGLLEVSPEFAELWERQDVAPGGQTAKGIEHPVVGALFFESTQLKAPARPDLTIVLRTPQPDTETAVRLEWMATPEGRRESMYPIAG